MASYYGSRKPVIDAAHLARQRNFSLKTFGPGPRTQGILDHIRKELVEIEQDPTDLGEWVDVVILALDGAWRAGHGPQEIIDAIIAKQDKNEARTWPDWRTFSEDEAIEHDRSDELRVLGLPVEKKETTCPRCSSWFTESRNAVGDEQMLCGHKWHEVY